MTTTPNTPNTPNTPGNKPRTPTMQVICLTTTDGISHEFFGPSLLRNDQTGQMAYIKAVNFGPELTLEEVQEILAHHASYPNPATNRSLS